VTTETDRKYTGNEKGFIQGWANEKIFEKNSFKKTICGSCRLLCDRAMGGTRRWNPNCFQRWKRYFADYGKYDQEPFKTNVEDRR
jgi:hypothetical protein